MEAGASVHGVARSFRDVRALAGVDLALPAGTLTVLAGPNGAGKTTLLRILAGLLAPDEGQVRLPPRSAIGYLPQDLALDPELTGRETLALFAALYGVPRRQRPATIESLAAAFGITEPLDRLVATWSGGLKRRLHLAAGMIHDPALLLLDEPTAGLDQEGSDFLWRQLRRRAEAGRTLAVVTHDLAAAQRHGDRVAILHGGRLLAAGVLAAGVPGELLAEHGASDLADLHRRLTGQEPEAPGAGRPRRRKP